MAIFLLRAIFGSDFRPLPQTGRIFDDVEYLGFGANYIDVECNELN